MSAILDIYASYWLIISFNTFFGWSIFTWLVCYVKMANAFGLQISTRIFFFDCIPNFVSFVLLADMNAIIFSRS